MKSHIIVATKEKVWLLSCLDKTDEKCPIEQSLKERQLHLLAIEMVVITR